jgi:hypothetical protein
MVVHVKGLSRRWGKGRLKKKDGTNVAIRAGRPVTQLVEAEENTPESFGKPACGRKHITGCQYVKPPRLKRVA